jgi:hypothetical protein
MRSERCANQQGSPNDDGLSNTQNVRHAAYTTQSKCLQEGKDCLLQPSNNWNHLSGIKLDNTDFEDSHDAKTTLSAYMSQRDYHRQHHLISSHRSFSHESRGYAHLSGCARTPSSRRIRELKATMIFPGDPQWILFDCGTATPCYSRNLEAEGVAFVPCC